VSGEYPTPRRRPADQPAVGPALNVNRHRPFARYRLVVRAVMVECERQTSSWARKAPQHFQGDSHMRKPSKKVVVGVAAVAIALGTASGAYAYWSTSGSGTGSASTGTSSSVTVTQVGSITALSPGSTAQAVDFKINNPASTKQYIASVAVSISAVDANPDGGTCSAADFTVVQPNAINQDLLPGDSSFSPSGATLAMKNLATNQDGCKNATVHLAFDAS
jgi:hypothetical protein